MRQLGHFTRFSACAVPPPSGHSTNPRFIFLREIGSQCLKSFLDTVVIANAKGYTNSPYWGGTLVVDQVVEMAVPLTLPAKFTLAGVGINGGGRLRFRNLGGEPALRIQNVEGYHSGYSVVRDLAIEGASGAEDAGGVRIDNPGGAGNHFFDNVLIDGFAKFGVQGLGDSYSVHFANCIVRDNGTNFHLGANCNTWRLTDCIIQGGKAWGVLIDAPLNDLVISGCRFQGNASGGIRIAADTFGVMVIGNGFAENGGVGISVRSQDAMMQMRALSTRIVGNIMLRAERIVDLWLTGGLPAQPQSTLVAFNASTYIPLDLTDSDERLYVYRAK